MQNEEGLFQACMRVIGQQTFHQAYWKTFEIVEADTDALRQQAFQLRYSVYCTDARFSGETASAALIEKDAYDDRAIHHLLIHSNTGQAVGTVRTLLPSASDPGHSFEAQSLCKHALLQNDDRSQHLCEISRLCMVTQFRRRPGDGRFLPAYSEQESGGDLMPLGKALVRRSITYAPLGLMMAAYEAAMDRGILDCVSLMDPADFRSLKRLGMPYKVLGPRVNLAVGLQPNHQPIIYNIKNVLDSMEAVNPECWEVLSDKGRLNRRANEIQLENWHTGIFDEAGRPGGFMSRFL